MERFQKSRSIIYHCALLTKLSEQASNLQGSRQVLSSLSSLTGMPTSRHYFIFPEHVHTDQNPNPSSLHLKTHNSLGEEKSSEWGITQICVASHDVFKRSSIHRDRPLSVVIPFSIIRVCGRRERPGPAQHHKNDVQRRKGD